MFMGSVIGYGCNYLYQVYVGRALGPEGYGAFGALFSIFYLIYVFSGTIQAGSARFVSKYNTTGETDVIKSLLLGLIKRAALVGIAFFFLFFIFSSEIAEFLNIQSAESVIILGTVAIPSFLLPIASGTLQGLQKFSALSLVNVLTFLPKLLLGVIFITLGYSISGAIGAVSLGLTIAFISSMIPLRSYFTRGQKNNSYEFNELYSYSLPAVIIMVCLAMPSNMDVILSKHFFSSNEAGLYAAAAVIGKIVLFLPSFLYAVMFPKVSKMQVLKSKTRFLLNRSLIYTGLLSGVAAAIFISSPFLVGAIFGANYLYASQIMRFYVIVMFFLSLIWVIAQYCLATNNLRYSYVLLFFTLAEFISISLFHGTPLEMVIVLLSVNLILFIASFSYVIWSEGRDNYV